MRRIKQLILYLIMRAIYRMTIVEVWIWRNAERLFDYSEQVRKDAERRDK